MVVRGNVLRMLCVAVALTALCATARADLIFSENFDSPLLPNINASASPAAYATGTSGNLLVYGSGNYANPFPDGAGQYLVTNPVSGDSGGIISWEFAVGVGQYTLTFDHRSFGSSFTESLAVSVQGGAVLLPINDSVTDPGGGYPSAKQTYSKVFTTTSAGMVTLTLTDTTPNARFNSTDQFVDNIQVNGPAVSTPEPGTIVLLVTGLIGLLAYAWRKRR